MKFYIFLSTQGHSSAPGGEWCDNCQMLGTAGGTDVQDAWEALLIETPFIKDMGYDKKGVFAYEIGREQYHVC